MSAVVSRNGKGVIVYPNPLVADLMASGIVNRFALLDQHRIQPSADMMFALARLQSELDDFADAVMASIEFLEGRSLGTARNSQYVVRRDAMHDDVMPGRVAQL
jgi:hypothetical protein